MGSLVFYPFLILPLFCCSVGRSILKGFRNSSPGWRVGEVLQSDGSDRSNRYNRWYARAGVASLQQQVHPGWVVGADSPLSPSPRLRSSPTHGVCSGHNKHVLFVHFYHMYSGSVGRFVDTFLVLPVRGTSPSSFWLRWSGISKHSSCSGVNWVYSTNSYNINQAVIRKQTRVEISPKLPQRNSPLIKSSNHAPIRAGRNKFKIRIGLTRLFRCRLWIGVRSASVISLSSKC